MARNAAVGVPAPDPEAVDVDVAGPAIVSIKVGPGLKSDVRILISEDEEGSSSMSSVFTLCNSAIGAGVLSLPYAFRKSGVLIWRLFIITALYPQQKESCFWCRHIWYFLVLLCMRYGLLTSNKQLCCMSAELRYIS